VPFKLRWTRRALAEYERIVAAARTSYETRRQTDKGKSSRQEGLFGQVTKCLANLSENPRHPALRTHEYDSLEHPYDAKGKVFEAYAQNDTPGAYRVFWCYGPQKGEITIITITPHP
jgi:hypothetical protein